MEDHLDHKKKYIWLSDLHLDTLLPWTFIKFINHIRNEKPDGLFLTGDISNGLLLSLHLKIIAHFIKCPLYFILGNHDLHFKFINKQYSLVKKLCKKIPNLIWMDNVDVIPLNKETCVIGADGWYDALNGEEWLFRFTFDWFMIKDFRNMPDMKTRVDAWQNMAKQSANNISNKLNKALEQGYKTIYILTHVPAWKNATKDVNTLLEKYWLPYNCNAAMGQAIEDIMQDHKSRRAVVLCGHSHDPLTVQVSRNIECRVGKARYIGIFSPDENIIMI